MLSSVVKRFQFVFVAVLLTGFSSIAQTQARYQLTGSVRSAETHEPLPGATIRVIGTALGTTTNSEGNYRLLLQPGAHRLVFSFIGFDPDTVQVQLSSGDSIVDVLLPQGEVSLPEVVVYPQLTNPADEIIRRAIVAKQKWQARLHSYDFDAYTKTVLRVDTSGKNSDAMIAGILETQTKGYWKAPDSYREIVTAKRQTANFTSEQNIFTAGRVLNFNDDIVNIDRYTIPGPTSASALDNYHFAILDTIRQGGTRIYRLAINPKESASPLFKGSVDIAGGSYALVHTRLTLSDPAALDPLRNAVYDEQFAEYDDTFWLPIEIRTTFTVKFILPPVPPILFENTSVLYDYRINPEIPNAFFNREVASASTSTPDVDSTAWRDEQLLPLTNEEVLAYARLDSLARNMPFYLKAILFLTQLPDQAASWPLTSLSDFYHFNRVEGSYLGVGLTSSTLLDRMSLTAVGGYGFSDRMWKYDFGAGYALPFADGVAVGGSVFRRLANREEEDIYSRFEVTIGALLYRDDYRDYYLSKGWNIFAKWRLDASWKAGIRYDDEEQTSVRKNTNYSIISQDYNYRDNPAIDDGIMRSVGFSLNLDTRKNSGTGMSMQSEEGSSYWVGDVSADFSSPRYFNSSFSFDRYRVSLLRHQMTFASGFLNVWAIGGFSEGTLPVQRMFEIQATYGGYAQAQVLSTLSIQRILSGKAIVCGIEHDFPSTLFRWTGVPLVRDIWFDLTLFMHGAAAEGYSPMSEAGFGLINILPFIRTDFTWGVSGACRGFAWTLETTLGI